MTRDALRFLNCTYGPPTIRQLNRLIHAYVRRVPWETVFRIIKRHRATATAECPRLPVEFWQDALAYGGGGTCYEDNYAFLSLLTALGYHGYMTVNDMDERKGCHAAIVISLGERQYLVDVSIPILAAIPLQPGVTTRRNTLLYTIIVEPYGDRCYQIERTRHPIRNIYTLMNVPVGSEDYIRVIEQDYSDSGQFLDRVIIVKLVGDKLYRFNSGERPYRLEMYDRRGKHVLPLKPETLVRSLAEHFRMHAESIATALSLTEELAPLSPSE